MYVHTADFIKKVLSVYTHAMKTISIPERAAISNFFMKSPVHTIETDPDPGDKLQM